MKKKKQTFKKLNVGKFEYDTHKTFQPIYLSFFASTNSKIKPIEE